MSGFLVILGVQNMVYTWCDLSIVIVDNFLINPSSVTVALKLVDWFLYGSNTGT